MFKLGDVVQLKSGGPVMTITHMKETSCECSWFKDDAAKNCTFPSDALEAYEAPDYSADEY